MKLNPTQKDYFDIEKGLPDKNFDSLDTNIRELFATLEGTEDLKIFRKNKLEMYKEYPKKGNFKAEFARLFHSSDKINRTTLVKRANSSELVDILQKIKELL